MYTIKITQDQQPESPREWDNTGKMICFHRRYNLGDKHKYSIDDHESWDDLERAILKEKGPGVILPLYLYDHSGITMNTTGFSCGWDSGRVGFIYVSKKDILKELGGKNLTKTKREKAEEWLRREVVVYDHYLTGNVWMFEVVDEDGDSHDSCSGFYGDPEGVVEDMKAHISNEILDTNPTWVMPY